MQLIPPALAPHVRRFGWSGLAAVALVVVMLAGVNPITLISGQVSPPPPPTSITGVPAASATPAQLAAYPPVVAGEAELMWRRMFWQTALRWPQISLSVLPDSSQFGCGMAGKDLTVFYCPDNRTVYVDTGAYERLRQRFPLGADFALAHLVAEAYGHHVQWTLGVFTDLTALRSRGEADAAAELERQIDLQGACYAAMWAITAGIDELDDNAAVMAALDQVEANRQRAIVSLPLGRVVAEVLALGDDAARRRWYSLGYAIPAPGSCKLEKIAADG